MHRCVVLVAFGVASVLAIKEECLQLSHPHALACCKMPSSTDDSIKECFESFGKKSNQDETDCGLEVCIGKIRGYVDDDGTVDKKGMEIQVAEKYKDKPELFDKIMKTCVNADVKLYGSEGTCDLKKSGRCVRVQLMMACPLFDDKGDCSEIKALAENCAAE